MNDLEFRQQILDSGGLGIAENQIKRTVENVINSLVQKGVFERKGQYIKYGKNFEKFDQGGSDSSVLSDEDLIQRTTGFGGPSTTSRQAWGGEGGPMSSYFG